MTIGPAQQFIQQVIGLNVDGPSSAKQFRFIHISEVIANIKPIQWQVQNVIPENSFYYDFGDSGTYKSFVALDRLLHIACGMDYHGHPVKQGTVFYIAGEGAQGLARRYLAWMIHYGLNPKDIPFFQSTIPTELMEIDSVTTIRREIDAMAKEYGPPQAVHIDTLSRNFGSGDESAPKDMARVISNLDTVFSNDYCRSLTHHTGHNNKDRARGPYNLHCAADAEFQMSLTPFGQVLVECKKMKDAPKAAPMLFNLKTVMFLIDGKPDQSCVMTLEAEGAEALEAKQKEINLSKQQRDALEILEKMYEECFKNLRDSGRDESSACVTFSAWSDRCVKEKLYSKPANFTKSFDKMKKRRAIATGSNGLHVWPLSIYFKYHDKDAV